MIGQNTIARLFYYDQHSRYLNFKNFSLSLQHFVTHETRLFCEKVTQALHSSAKSKLGYSNSAVKELIVKRMQS